MQHHLRIQLTLIPASAGGRRGPILPGEFRTVLTASARHFSALLHLPEMAAPGGAAIHCDVTFLDWELAAQFFPPGAQFELWEGGRKGYGSVLAKLE